MGNTTPEIRASVEDVLSKGQRLIADKAIACQVRGSESARSAELARACFEQYAEGVADALDALGPDKLGETMRAFAKLKIMQMEDARRSH